MSYGFLDIAVTPSVRAAQTANGAGGLWSADIDRPSDRFTAAEDLESVRSAGFTDAQIIEIVAVVAENFLTNLINNVADTAIDFPVTLTAIAA